MSHDLQIFTGKDFTLDSDDTLSGVKLLAQKFLIELLTERGSMKYLPLRGCNFLSRLRKEALSEFDVFVAFATARNQIRRTLVDEVMSDTPLDERYRTSKLNQVILTPGAVKLDITVRSHKGSAVRFVTPLISK